jgi:hypothetical protein
VNHVAGHRAERAAEAADDAGLAAMMNVVVADDVAADFLLRPAALFQRILDRLVVAFLRAALAVPFVGVLAERDAAAAGVADFVVFDDPAFAPVGCDQADLAGARTGPIGGGVTQLESAHGDVVNVRLRGREHGRAHADLDLGFVRVHAREPRPDRCVFTPVFRSDFRNRLLLE